jgi:hypothetical protein
MRRPPPLSATSCSRRFETSLKRLKSAHSGRSCEAQRMAVRAGAPARLQKSRTNRRRQRAESQSPSLQPTNCRLKFVSFGAYLKEPRIPVD